MNNSLPPDSSPEPSLPNRNRTIKAQPNPAPKASAVQMFAAGSVNQQSQSQPQGSPVANSIRIMSPAPPTLQRGLPTPPQATPPNVRDSNAERRSSPATSSNLKTHNPRPIHISQYQSIADWVSPEPYPDVERGDPHQAPGPGPTQNQNLTQPNSSYPPAYPRFDSQSPPKEPGVERSRVTDRTSPPKDMENGQQRRTREQQARESPQARDRQQPTSPPAPPYSQIAHSNSPDHRISPTFSAEGSVSYSPYSRDSPPVQRRVNPPINDARPLHSGITSQSPPSQTSTRTPDRDRGFIPVHEEPEDEPATSSKRPSSGRDRDSWGSTDRSLHDSQHAGSPLPSSDLNPEGNSSRYDGNHIGSGLDSRPLRRSDDASSLIDQGDLNQQRSPDESDTPRSLATGLPDDARYHQAANTSNMRPTVRTNTKPRNASGDLSGMPAINSMLDSHPQVSQSVPQTDRPPQYADNRRPPPKAQPSQPPTVPSHSQTQPSQPSPLSQPNHPTHQAPKQATRPPPTPAQPHPQRIIRPPVVPPYQYSDDLAYYDDPVSPYIQAYLQSPRPEAPIPATPYSQTTAPSPLPMLSRLYNTDGRSTMEMPPFSPIPPAGSPFPFPFSHVRRPASYSSSNPGTNPNRLSAQYDPGNPSAFLEQIARQWQTYAMNYSGGHMTDSTFSPSTTPFQPGMYQPWANWHTKRQMGTDARSIASSPSHEPVPLPVPPKKKKDKSQDLRRQTLMPRKPPPRVQSTQPRDTSPELSSSGEETAGEEDHHRGRSASRTEEYAHPLTDGEDSGGGTGDGGSTVAATEQYDWLTGPGQHDEPSIQITVMGSDDDGGIGEWVDEEDDDDSDLLELEYHPSFVKPMEKRRRKWEVGWEALCQAFQNLDRQTDATMVLLASPSHTTKLYSLQSRSVRRRPPHSPLSAHVKDLRRGFSKIALHRRNTRSHTQSLRDRFNPGIFSALSSASSVGGHGSVSGSNASAAGEGSETGGSETEHGVSGNEVELRRALSTALGSLRALGGIYEQRETRWIEEMRRLKEDRESVELLLRQVLGPTFNGFSGPPLIPGMSNGHGHGLTGLNIDLHGVGGSSPSVGGVSPIPPGFDPMGFGMMSPMPMASPPASNMTNGHVNGEGNPNRANGTGIATTNGSAPNGL
ncbi:hypothetical protein AX16_000177 [Volvariella volvacea WC 439]|nr:hypothetical protein AX16_000177 [Volvariella volvacea WC 439]